MVTQHYALQRDIEWIVTLTPSEDLEIASYTGFFARTYFAPQRRTNHLSPTNARAVSAKVSTNPLGTTVNDASKAGCPSHY
jgi:hypothetical protein